MPQALPVEPPTPRYLLRRSAARASLDLTVAMAVGFASLRQARLAALVDRMHELSENLIPAAERDEPWHVVRELERELHSVALAILALTSQRDALGARRPFATFAVGAS